MEARLRTLLLVAIAVPACRPEPDAPHVTFTTPPVDDPLLGVVGSVAVTEALPAVSAGRLFVFASAQFVTGDAGLANAAGCQFGEPRTCVTGYPAEGESVAAALDALAAHAELPSVNVGLQFRAGTALLTRVSSPDDMLYYADYNLEDLPEGVAGIEITDEVLTYEGDSDFTHADSIALLLPDPAVPVALGPGEVLHLEWTPGGIGDILFEHGDTVTHLADDGDELVTPATLGLEAPLDVLEVSLGRMTLSEFSAGGPIVRVQTRSDQLLRLEYTDLSGYAPLTGAESCADAAGTTPLAPGKWFGDFSGYIDNYDAGDFLSGATRTHAADIVVPVAVLAGQALAITYRVADYGTAYLLTASCDEAYTVSVPGVWPDPISTITWTAPRDEVVHLVLDGQTRDHGVDPLFTLDLTVD